MARCLASPRKVRYRSQAEAGRVAFMQLMAHGQELRPYRCSGCNGWHLATVQRG